MTTQGERLQNLETLVGEIHVAVVGDGSKNSSLRERVAQLESANTLSHRAINAAIPTVLSTALGVLMAHFGISTGVRS